MSAQTLRHAARLPATPVAHMECGLPAGVSAEPTPRLRELPNVAERPA
jgi:hypothetical protein